MEHDRKQIIDAKLEKLTTIETKIATYRAVIRYLEMEVNINIIAKNKIQQWLKVECTK
jgi:hypothetical protein